MEKKNIINNQPLSDDELVAMFFEESRQEIAVLGRWCAGLWVLRFSSSPTASDC